MWYKVLFILSMIFVFIVFASGLGGELPIAYIGMFLWPMAFVVLGLGYAIDTLWRRFAASDNASGGVTATNASFRVTRVVSGVFWIVFIPSFCLMAWFLLPVFLL